MSIEAWKKARKDYQAAQLFAARPDLSVVDVLIREGNGAGNANSAFNGAVQSVLQDNLQQITNQALNHLRLAELEMRRDARTELNALLADAQD